MRRISALVLIGLAATLAAPPAAGDWIVLRDGSRVETRGSWKIEGRQLVFTRPDGTLASLRAADVDLEASSAASREPAEPAVEPAVESPPRRPVLVLTNEDLPPPRDAAEEEDLEAEGEAAAEALPGSEKVAAREPVEIVSWDERDSDEAAGLEIRGTVRNSGLEIAAEIQVTVTVARDEGEPPLEARAFLQSPALGPGQTTAFRALLPGIYSLSGEPAFEVRSEAFDLRPRAQSAASEAEETQDEPPPRP